MRSKCWPCPGRTNNTAATTDSCRDIPFLDPRFQRHQGARPRRRSITTRRSVGSRHKIHNRWMPPAPLVVHASDARRHPLRRPCQGRKCPMAWPEERPTAQAFPTSLRCPWGERVSEMLAEGGILASTRELLSLLVSLVSKNCFFLYRACVRVCLSLLSLVLQSRKSYPSIHISLHEYSGEIFGVVDDQLHE